MTGDALFVVGSVLVPIFATSAARALRRDSPAAPSPHWARQLLHDVLIFVAVASALHLGVEIYYRTIYDTTDGINVSRVSQRWFERHWKLNAQGFRDDVDYQPAIAAGKRRISFVGDSFTAAQGISDVGDRFANVIRSAKIGWEVEAIAQNGAATGFEIEMLESLASRGHAFDIVVLVYVWNDIRPLLPKRIRPQTAAALRRPEGLGFLMDHSYGFNTLYYRLKRATLPRDDPERNSDAENSPYANDTWQKQRAVLERFVAVANERGATLVALVAFPRVRDMEGGEYAFGAMHDRLAEFASEEGVPYLDLLPLLREHATERSLTVNRSDGHPNGFVHGEVAREIAAFLEPLVLATPR